MSIIQDSLEPLSGFLFSIKRDTVKGWYFLEVGLPKSWVYKGNDVISCEKTGEWDKGILLSIAPLVKGVTVDDLIIFASLILETNNKIVEKEKEFVDRIETVKNELQKQKDVFYKELDDLKEKSFSLFDFKKDDEEKENKGRGRPKGSKNKKKDAKEEAPIVVEKNEIEKDESKSD